MRGIAVGLVLLSVGCAHRRSMSALRQQQLERAIALDARNAEAYAQLAMMRRSPTSTRCCGAARRT